MRTNNTQANEAAASPFAPKPEAKGIKKTLYRETGDGEQLTIEVSTERGYWSVTGEIRAPGSKVIHSCGCLHEAILEAAPELEPIVAVHLADVEFGAPMHAVANAQYFRKGLLDKLPVPNHAKVPDYWFNALRVHLSLSADATRKLLQDTQFEEAAFVAELCPGGSVGEHWMSLNNAARETFEAIGEGIPVGAPTDEVFDPQISFTAEHVFWSAERKAQEWLVTLERSDAKGTRKAEFPFFCGSAAPDPTLDVVLECLISDAHTGDEYANDPDGFADDMGLGAVQAQEMLVKIDESTKRLEFVLGDVRDEVFAQYR